MQEVNFFCEVGLSWQKVEGASSLDVTRLCGYVCRMENETKIFKALTNETRLSIVALIAQRGVVCLQNYRCTGIAPINNIRAPRLFEKQQLGSGRRQGLWMYYHLNNGEHDVIREMLPILERHIACKAAHVMALERLQEFQKERNQQVC